MWVSGSVGRGWPGPQTTPRPPPPPQGSLSNSLPLALPWPWAPLPRRFRYMCTPKRARGGGGVAAPPRGRGAPSVSGHLHGPGRSPGPRPGPAATSRGARRDCPGPWGPAVLAEGGGTAVWARDDPAELRLAGSPFGQRPPHSRPLCVRAGGCSGRRGPIPDSTPQKPSRNF